MIKTYFSSFLFALVSSSLHAKTPTYQDFPAFTHTGKNQPLKLNNKSKKYRTLFKEISQQQPNFAGQYVMHIFGCGGGCSSALAYNAKTGQSFILGQTFGDCYHKAKGYTANDIVFDLKSRLVVATGTRDGNQAHCETVYYVVDQDHFKEIASKKRYQ